MTRIRELISHCTVIDINSGIKEEVITLRRHHHMKLPDCIIAASSIHMDIPLISADTDFKEVDNLDFLHYQKTG